MGGPRFVGAGGREVLNWQIKHSSRYSPRKTDTLGELPASNTAARHATAPARRTSAEARRA